MLIELGTTGDSTHAVGYWDMNLGRTAPFTSASTVASLHTQHSSRASPYPSSSTAGAPITTFGGMAAPSFLPPQSTLRPVSSTKISYPLTMPSLQFFDGDTNGSLYQKSSPVHVLIRRLPPNTTEDDLRLMLVWSMEWSDIRLLPLEQSEDAGFLSAVVQFKSMAGANEAKKLLDGRAIYKDAADMVLEIVANSPVTTRRYPPEPASANPSSAASSAASSATGSRQPSHFNGPFQSLEGISSPINSSYSYHEFPNSDAGMRYPNFFSPQSPIGNHLAERPRISGKTLIANDSPDDDETSDLLKDPVAYAENGATTQRRATAPQIPVGRMAGLSLNTNNPQPGQSSMPPYANTMSAHSSSLSPLNGSSPSVGFPIANTPYSRQAYPPVNPADQNPPCNTLYVGNLPIDTSEEELKAMFSKQRGYKRLCFRTKQNGPMCFVEFEDISFATKALHELYGHLLHNSVKGGIRLSFSKNPLGVRGSSNGQGSTGGMNGMNSVVSGSPAGFATANGPPPGLSAPPGLGSGRAGYSGSSAMNPGHAQHYGVPNFPHLNNPWTGPGHNSQAATGGPGIISPQPSSYPPYMTGRYDG